MPGIAPLSLYLHIPFCKKKCPYCQFYSIANYEQWLTRFEEALLHEIETKKELLTTRYVPTIYFGGGTPFLLSTKSFEHILNVLPKTASEITIEANPETVTLEKLHELRALGINRISIGVQSFNDTELKILERTHSQNQAVQAIENAYSAGFTNISIDLMYELPEQTTTSWKQTLDHVANLPITHISLYNLVIEENTAFKRREKELRKAMPGDDIGKEMYECAIDTLATSGFEQYEISAFAKNKLYSQHNLGYWTGRDFLGFGPAAFSSLGNKRFENVSNITKYVEAMSQGQSAVDFEEEDIEDEHTRLVFILNLRCLLGAPLPEKLRTDTILTKLTAFVGDGYLTKEPLPDNVPIFRLTRKGILFYDTIASELL